MQALGETPFETAAEKIIAEVSATYKKTGSIAHQLMGIHFSAGAISGAVAVEIRRKSDVVRMREHMLNSFPMVAHIFEAWIAPDSAARPSQHAQRQDVVAIMLHIEGAMGAINCVVDPLTRSITPGPIIVPDQVEGNFRRELGPRHS